MGAVSMLARSALLLVALLLVVAALSNILSPRDIRSGTGAAAAGAAAEAARQAASAGQVTAQLPSDKPIAAKVGDVVTLNARADTEDVVDVPAFGVDSPVGPGEPAQLQLVADQAGRFPIVLQYEGRQLGTLVVTPAS
jgi:hypothetical protein